MLDCRWPVGADPQHAEIGARRQCPVCAHANV